MIVARLTLGPHDGERLILPADQEDPWPQIVIPKFGAIQLQWLYLRAGRLEEMAWAYLFEDEWVSIVE